MTIAAFRDRRKLAPKLYADAREFTERTDLFGEDVQLTVSYNFLPGYKGVKPSLYDPGEPDEPDAVEIVAITVQKLKCERYEPAVFGKHPVRLPQPVYTPVGPVIAIEGELFNLLAGGDGMQENCLADSRDD